jgi:glycosyltransferase involved in cell wall biosynthesis
MKVAILASLLRPISPESNGGTEAFAHILTEGLVQKGADVTLFATSDSKTDAKLVSVCSSTQTNGVSEGTIATNVLYEMFQSRNVIQQSKDFDVIHNNYFHFYNLTNFAAFTDRPIITTMHNHFWESPGIKEILVKTHRKGKDVVVFASRAAQKLAENLVDTEVIYHGIDISAFPFSAQTEDYVLWFSRLVPDKGIKPAMDAALAGNFPLVVAGGLPVRPEHKKFVDEQVMPFFSDTIKYAGVPDEEQRLSLYQHAKALLFPTALDEQFGLVLAEAMACGTPVIGYNRGAVSEVIKDGVTGFVIDPDDTPRPGKGSWVIKKQGVEGLIEAVNRFGEIDRSACRAHIEKNFSRKRMVEEYMKLYERVA